MPAMFRTPRPLTSALAAALAAGTVVAVSAVAEPGADRPARAAAAKGWRAAPPPTREQAIRQAADARDEFESLLAEGLRLEPAKVREAQRAIVARRLTEEVSAQRLTAAQRDALLACFDDPVGCDRAGLPAARLGESSPYALPATPLVVPQRLRPLRKELEARRRAARRRAAQQRRRRSAPRKRPAQVRRVPRPLLLAGPHEGLARELGVSQETLAKALRDAARKGAGTPPRVDPDGVPLGFPTLPVPLVVPTTPPLPPQVARPVPAPAVPAPAPGPGPRRPRAATPTTPSSPVVPEPPAAAAPATPTTPSVPPTTTPSVPPPAQTTP